MFNRRSLIFILLASYSVALFSDENALEINNQKQTNLKGFVERSIVSHAISDPSSHSYTQIPQRFVAIIMDDLGNDLPLGKQLLEISHNLTYSFLPHTHYIDPLTTLARKKNKEIMLHLPMQPISNKNMGRGGLTDQMQRQQFVETVWQDIHAIPGAVGINNHMGSLLTQNRVQMGWLMEELKSANEFYFVDSRTHASSVAAKQANINHVPNTSRDIFLDHVIEKSDIDYQFQRLVKRINSRGYALAIGHPHRETIDALKRWLPRLQAQGIKIVTVSRYISMIETRSLLWQASLYRSHKVVKN